jgi:hypothetical protein
MKALLLHALLTLLIVSLALVAYDRFVRRPAARVGLIDVGEVVRLKDARVLDVLTKAMATDGEKKAAIDFGTRFTAVFPQALEELTQECDCLVLARSAVAGLPPHAVELTATLKQKVGL